jgi:hypothetical protein
MPGTLTATNVKMDGMVTDVKNLVEIATIYRAIKLTEHAPLALMDSAEQDAIYVRKINI